MKYKWNSKKVSRKQHLCDDRGFTYCKAENGSWRFDTLSDTPDPKRATCSICEHMVKTAQSPRHDGKPNPNTTKPNKRDLFLHTWEWKQVRYHALKRSNGRCQACGRGPSEGAVLNVDHIKPRKLAPELALTLSNLQVLCQQCNVGKGNWDQTDWRESRLSVVT